MEAHTSLNSGKKPFSVWEPKKWAGIEKTVCSMTIVTRVCLENMRWVGGLQDILKGKTNSGGRKEPSTGDHIKVWFGVRVIIQGNAHFWRGRERLSFVKVP